MVPPNNLELDLNGKAVNETRYQANLKESHLIVVKRIFRYLKGTLSLGLWYPKCSGFDLKGYSDSNYAGCNMDRKSTSGACQFLGGKLVCWSAKKQQYVAMSSAKVKYVVVAGCLANILWMKSQLTDYDIIYEKVPIFCNNTSAIAILNNQVLHSRTKHIDIRYHFIRDHIIKGDIELHFIPPNINLLNKPTFKRLIVELMNRRLFTVLGVRKAWGKTGGYDQISNKDALIHYCLANGVNIDFAKLIWDDLLVKMQKKHKETIITYTRFISLLLEHKMQETYENDEATPIPTPIFNVNNWALKKDQPEGPLFTDHMLAIFTANEPVGFKAPKTTPKTKELGPKGKMLGVKTRRRKIILFAMNHPQSKIEAQKGEPLLKEAAGTQTGHSKRRKQSVTAKDKNQSHPSVSIPVLNSVESVSHQETIISASNIVHSESASGHDASTDFITESDPGKFDPKDSLSKQQDGLGTVQSDKGTKKAPNAKPEFDTSPDLSNSTNDDDDDEIKLEDLTKMVMINQSKYLVRMRLYADTQAKTEETSVSQPPSLKSIKIQELTNQVLILQSQKLKPEKDKATVEAEFTLLTAQPSFLNVQQLTELQVNALKHELTHLLTNHDFSASIPTELKELSSKVTKISRAVGDLKQYMEKLEIEVLENFKLDILAGLLALPRHVSLINAHLSKLKVLDALPRLLNKVAKAMDRFATATELASKKAGDQGENVQDKGKKAMSHEEVAKEDSDSDFDAEIRLTGIEQAVKADVAKSKIKKGKKYLIDIFGHNVVDKVYKDKIINNFKISDLHLGEWREVMQACPKMTGAGWTTIYTQMRQKLDALHQTEEELELDLSKPLKEQDLIIKMNLLARKKRKNADDLHDYFKSQKSIKDFEELNNDMLYNVKEIFFILHQGPGMDDLTRTFSSLLVAKVYKRNLNPNKQTRLVEQLSLVPFSLSVDLNIKYAKSSLAEDNYASSLQALRRLSNIFTSVYVAVQKLKIRPWQELLFSLVGNAKLNDVDLLSEA
ncbi:hypothetical protein Tco_0099096 [Tanacetum coccineum]